MIFQLWNAIMNYYHDNWWMKPLTAIVGAVLIYASYFQLPLRFSPVSPFLLPVGMSLEVFLTYVYASGTKQDREAIEEQKREIKDAVETLQELQDDIEVTVGNVFELEGEIRDAHEMVGQYKQDAEDANESSQTALNDVEDLKKSIIRSLQ